jgi:acetate kinase
MKQRKWWWKHIFYKINMNRMNESSKGNHSTYILTVNAGSSSVKLALFSPDEIPEKLIEGEVENIGQHEAALVLRGKAVSDEHTRTVMAADHLAATRLLMEQFRQWNPAMLIAAVGHRIVHGGPMFYESQIITNDVLRGIAELAPFDPLHLPIELQLIGMYKELFPAVPQIACFDTAFHHGLPTRAKLFALPRRLAVDGIRRYGFHGLSYAFVLEELKRVEGEPAANGKVIIAHLGSGASLVALKEGRSIDTTMGFTPAAGVPMGTRSGDLDPGIGLFLARHNGYDMEQFNDLVNTKSGLLGISETTSDMKELLENEATDERAKDAVDIFCYQVKKSIGGLAAALGGITTLVFTGGMGEAAPKIRARICEDLEFLGIQLDTERNKAGERLISAGGSPVGVHVIHTDESATIARETAACIHSTNIER